MVGQQGESVQIVYDVDFVALLGQQVRQPVNEDAVAPKVIRRVKSRDQTEPESAHTAQGPSNDKFILL